MKVIELLNKDFTNACHELADKVLEDACPDTIIGVLTGGGVVGREMLEQFKSKGCKPNYLEFKIQRQLTKKKESVGVRSLLRKMPRSITKRLILMEVLVLELKSKFVTPKRDIDYKLDNELREEFANPKSIGSLLIIDDCIDTGATVQALVSHINTINQNIKIKVAVITVTHKNPLIKADYQLFERTICRFPWSMEIQN
ncbi:MAG: hypoxanthine phosphoribosyltransferase [Parvicella sp.]|jgi:hypoxanthine phosphoribosyltransferase